jgi:nucleotide-binding universal stress UspA family protein
MRNPTTTLAPGASAATRPRRAPALILLGANRPDAEALGARLGRSPADVVVVSDTHAGRHQIQAVLHDAPCPVVVAPMGYAERVPAALRRIGVAFDGWEPARVALAKAAALAEDSRGELVLLTASDPHIAPSAQGWDGDPLAGHRTVAERYLRTIVDEEVSPRIETRTRVLDGPVAAALTQACDAEQLDLLALGSRRRGPLARIALGSVSSALLHRPPACPLLICPG